MQPHLSRALVVDDDPVSRLILRRVLETLDFEVHEAKDGAAATRLLASLRPEFLTIDGLLPDTDGMSWLGQERDRLPPTVVFASSFWSDLKSHRRLTGELGVSLVVRKPLRPGELHRQLQALLASARWGASSEGVASAMGGSR